MPERLRLAGAAAVSLAFAAAGVGAGSTLATGHAKPKPKVKQPTAVRVVAQDFSYVLSRTSVPAGRVRFTVVNRGAVAHDFEIGTRRTRVLRPGQSTVLVASFSRGGRFAFRCTVPGHAALGMRGTLTVGRPPLPPTTTTKPATTTAPQTTASEPVRLQLTKIGDFARPVYVTAPPGDPNHLFVAEQRGTVQEVVDGQVRETPFLDVTDHVLEVSERGFLGIAFAPDYATSGLVYVDYTDRTGDGNVNVVEFRRSPDPPDHVDPYSARQILQIVKPYENHNAGMLQFGSDGYLYVAVGDGDSGVLNPPGAFAQTLDDLLGNILRIDPLHPDGQSPYSIPASNPFVGRTDARPEVWDYGLRNPWRFSIDPTTGDLYVGDAGEGEREEIDYAAGNRGGLNFGWPCFEGTVAGPVSGMCADPVAPVYDYDHGGGRCAVIGGVVVHDPRLPSLAGRYLFGDYCDGKLHSMRMDGGKATDVTDLGLTVPTLDSFSVDGLGRVYVTATDGGVYRLDPA